MTKPLFFPKQFTVRGSQCFKEWSPWCWMVWSGSRPACPPLPHLPPSSFHLFPRLGDCGRVPGWLVSHFLSFVSHFFSFVSHFFSIVSQFFSFVSQAGCLWSGSGLACLPLPFICLPLLFICLPLLFIVSQAGCLWSGSRPACLPLPFICLPSHLSPSLGACGRVPGWLVSHFLSFLFICFPGLSLLVSTLFRWPCSFLHWCCRPFPLAM